MTNKTIGITAGVLAGAALFGAVGATMLNSPKLKAKRLAVKTSQKLDTVGMMLQNMSGMIK